MKNKKYIGNQNVFTGEIPRDYKPGWGSYYRKFKKEQYA